MRSTSTARRLAAMLMTVPLACAMVGCSTPTDEPSVLPLFKSQIDSALADPNISDFERQVLSDYVITDEEFAQAMDLYTQCMTDRGWIVTPGDDGMITSNPIPGTTHSDYSIENDSIVCATGTSSNIASIYWEMQRNPAGLTPEQKIRACYERHGVPDGAGMTDDEFEKMVDDESYQASTPAGKMCYYDPDGSQGVTEESAERLDAQRGGPTIAMTCSPPSEPNGPTMCVGQCPKGQENCVFVMPTPR